MSATAWLENETPPNVTPLGDEVAAELSSVDLSRPLRAAIEERLSCRLVVRGDGPFWELLP